MLDVAGCQKKDDTQLIRQCVSKGSDLNILDEWKIEPENPNTIGSSFKPSIRRKAIPGIKWQKINLKLELA